MVKISHKRKAGRFWRRLFLWFVLVLLFLVLALGIVWHNRYALLEKQGQKKLAENGIIADFKIKTIGSERAILEKIAIERGQEQLFKADRIELEYQWKDALKKKFEKIIIISPEAKLTLDKNAKPKGLDFFSPNNSSGFEIPPKGIIVKSGKLDLFSPFIRGRLDVDIDFFAQDKWTVQIGADELFVTAGKAEQEFDIGAVIEKTDKDKYSFIGELAAENVKWKNWQAQKQKTNFNLSLSGNKITGWIKSKAKQINNSDVEINNHDLAFNNIKAVFDWDNKKITNYKLDWSLQTGVEITNKNKRLKITRNLMSLHALEKIPISKQFTNSLQTYGLNLLDNFQINAVGDINWQEDGYKISFAKPLKIKPLAASLKPDSSDLIWQSKNMPALSYNKKTKELLLVGNMRSNGRRALAVKDMSMVFISNNGFWFDAVKKIKARISSDNTWHEESAKIRPFDIIMDYKKPGSLGRLKIKGAVDYDGPVPGGEVLGMRAAGIINMQISGNGFSLDYTPLAETKIKNYINVSGWRAEQLKFKQEEAQELLLKQGEKLFLATNIYNVSSKIISPENDRQLDTKFAKMKIKADLLSSPQKWQIEYKNADIKSENFPAPGTKFLSENGNLNIFISPKRKLEFNADIPDADLRTNNIHAQNTKLKLSGTPDDINIVYDSKLVAMKGDIPSVPASGEARLTHGVLLGTAKSYLPSKKYKNSQNNPVKISYRSEKGIGTASVDIDRIIFRPNDLQPQDLISALRGRIADVEGEAKAHFKFEFGGGRPVRSYGEATLIDMDIGTLVGPLSGVNAKLEFSSVFPLKTKGVQSASVKLFDPGIPLKDGKIKFVIIEDGVDIKSAVWPFVNPDAKNGIGKIYISPTLWKFGPVKNKVVLNVENISLDSFLAGINKDRFYATGQIDGKLPAIIEGVNVIIDNGVLRIKDGGIIRFAHQGTDAAGKQNKVAGYAFDALKNFKYKKLEAIINGPLDGEILINLVFDGNNPDVLGGQSFLFNTSIKGELVNLMRNLSHSFSNNKNLARIIEIVPKEQK